MSGSRPKKVSFNREQWEQVIQSDPRLAEWCAKNRATAYAAAAPLMAELEQAGYGHVTPQELSDQGGRYDSAIPILLRWLPQIADEHVKESIVRALAVPWARPMAARPLFEEFLKPLPRWDSDIRWAIGLALSVVADESMVEELLPIVENRREYGASRQMIVEGLGKMRRSREKIIPVLIRLLSDDFVDLPAINALRRLKAVEARPALEKMRDDPRPHVRKAVARAIKALC